MREIRKDALRCFGLYILIAIFSLVIICPVAAQESAMEMYEAKSAFWTEFGWGFGYYGDFTGMGHYCASFYFQPHITSFRITGKPHPSPVLAIFPSFRMREYGILYGRALKRHPYIISIAAGWAFIAPQDDNAVFGLPIQLEIFKPAFACTGIGVYCFANINNASTFWGANLSIQLGNYENLYKR